MYSERRVTVVKLINFIWPLKPYMVVFLLRRVLIDISSLASLYEHIKKCSAVSKMILKPQNKYVLYFSWIFLWILLHSYKKLSKCWNPGRHTIFLFSRWYIPNYRRKFIYKFPLISNFLIEARVMSTLHFFVAVFYQNFIVWLRLLWPYPIEIVCFFFN